MLHRTSLLEKRKKKKNDVDKHIATCRGKVEHDLKASNKKSDADYVDLNQLDADSAKVKLSTEAKETLFPELKKLVSEYVTINNEYVLVKANEDKLKTKRQKDAKPASEVLEEAAELEKSVDSMTQ